MMQIGSFDEVPSITKEHVITRCQALRAQCGQQGQFLPMQCSENLCWCVDEAGNQLPLTNSFQKGEQQCGKLGSVVTASDVFQNLKLQQIPCEYESNPRDIKSAGLSLEFIRYQLNEEVSV